MNDTSVFPVALLENVVTRPIAYQGEEVAVNLSDEPMSSPFPMNCLCSTCRLTLIPGGLSVILTLGLLHVSVDRAQSALGPTGAFRLFSPPLRLASPVNLWVEYRDSHPPNGSRDFVGFRCAK